MNSVHFNQNTRFNFVQSAGLTYTVKPCYHKAVLNRERYTTCHRGDQIRALRQPDTLGRRTGQSDGTPEAKPKTIQEERT